MSKTEKADKLIQKIGEFQIAIQKIEQEMNEEIKKVKNQANRKVKPKKKAIEKRLITLFKFYQENWEKLTQKGKIKIVSFVTGQIGSYMTPPAVSIRNEKNVLKALETRNLKQFIRIIEGIDKEAILMNPDAVVGISGIKISQRERFMAKPTETEIAVSEDVKKLKKLLS